jgi:hypothetical protein
MLIAGMALVFLLAVLARFQQVSFFFLSDDFTLVDIVAQNGRFGVWSSQGAPFFRPLISLSFFLNYQLFGLDPAGYYLTNLLLHAANASLVSYLAWLFLRDTSGQPLPTGATVSALAAGACFAVTPTLGESVVWIAGRTDLIASFFGLLACAGARRTAHRAARHLACGPRLPDPRPACQFAPYTVPRACSNRVPATCSNRVPERP